MARVSHLARDGDGAAAPDHFASYVDDTAAARADDDDAAIVVASPKSTANASLVVGGARVSRAYSCLARFWREAICYFRLRRGYISFFALWE